MVNSDKKFSPSGELSGGALIAELQRLTEGLIFISETDAPVTLFSAKNRLRLPAKTVIGQQPGEQRTPVEEVPFDDLFKSLVRNREWYGKNETERATTYLKIRDLMKDSLSDLTVIRVGEVQIDIYAVGCDEHGDLVGIKTKAVET